MNYSRVILNFFKGLKLQESQLTQLKQMDWENSLKNYEEGAAKAAKLATKDANNPTTALELAGELSSAAATRNTKVIAAAAPSVIKFIHRGKNLILWKIQ